MTDLYAPNPATAMWEPARLAGIWTPPRVAGRVAGWNDYPCVMWTPAFSQRAVDVLGSLLSDNGELLPLESERGRYYVFNCTRVVDIVNLSTSTPGEIRIARTSEEDPIREYDYFDIDPSALNGLTVFRLRSDANGIYCTARFRQRVHTGGLRGFDFERIWPWPAGTRWDFEVAREKRERRRAERAAGVAGIDDQTLVIRLGTGGRRMPTKAQRAQVGRLMDSLDALLSDDAESPETPSIGLLKGDEPMRGEHRLFLICPDADRLAEHLRPWLRSAAEAWPGSLQVIRRYGPMFDENVREEVVEPL